MPKRSIACCCLISFFLSSSVSFADEAELPSDHSKFHLFLLAGQSNMAGRGKLDDAANVSAPRILSLGKDLTWHPATDPLHFDKPSIVGVGLGRTFAEDYAKQNPGITVGLIPCAVGGSPIAAWEPGGYHPSTKTHPYDDCLPRVKHALKSGVLKGILWHQGESDSKPKLSRIYESKLHALIDRFRTEFDTPDVPFIAGQMGIFPERPWDDERRLVDAAHQSLSQKVKNTAFANSNGLTHKGDKVHFSTDSYRELGHRYFAKFQQLTKPGRPNILLILADDVGREVLGCYGGESYETPNIDALAAGGQRYEHCYSMPVCHPTRISLLTGRYPRTLSNPKWGSFPREEESRTIAAVMKDAGYATVVAGKWQLSLMKKDLQQPARMGFDQWRLFGWHEGPRYHDPFIYENGKLRDDTAGKYGPDLYVDFLIDFMEQQRSQPFFAYYSMALCHDVTDDIGEPVPYGPDGHWLTYAEMAADMDHQVGRLIKALDRLKLRQETLVIFTTDNGTASASYLKFENGKFVRPKVFSRFKGQDVQGGKGKLTDWGIRVPLIVNQPGTVTAGQVKNDMVDFTDFLPTVTDVAGAKIPKDVELDGHSFASVIDESGHTNRLWAYAERRGGLSCVRSHDFKLYSNGRFYDMQADPEERTPLDSDDISAEADAKRMALQKALKSVTAASN